MDLTNWAGLKSGFFSNSLTVDFTNTKWIGLRETLRLKPLYFMGKSMMFYGFLVDVLLNQSIETQM